MKQHRKGAKVNISDKVFLTYNEIAEIFDIDHGTLRRWVSSGKFIQPYKISHTKALFKTTEINEWLDGKKETRSEVGF
jgi:predicted site-specific integrase-resolvase